MATLDGAVTLFGYMARLWEKQLVAFPFIVSFGVIMSAEFGQGPRQRAFAEQDQFRQVLLLGRADQRSAKAFRFGLLAGSGMAFTPPVASTDRNDALNLVSRSCRT